MTRFALVLFLFAELTSADVQPGLLNRSAMGRLAQKKIHNLTKRGALTSPCLNQPDCESEGPSQTQSETTVAVDSTGQHVVIGFNDFRGLLSSTVSLSGFMYSDDGGVTFVDGGQLPAGPTVIFRGQPFPQIFGDPDVKYLGGCNFVYSSLMLKASTGAGLVQTVAIHRSTDCGHTWTGPFEVVPASNPGARVDINGDALDAADKELGDVDPDTGRYMVCWTNFTPAAAEMSCAYSDNVLSGAPVFSARRVVASTGADGQGISVRFAGNGSPNAYVVWSRFPGTLSGYSNNVGYSRSTDNGVTWSAPINLAADFLTIDYILGNDRVNNNPSLAVDTSTGPHSGSVYVAYSNNNSLDGADVAFQRSADGGITFSPPIAINARPGADRAQWFPYVTADPVTGRVWVFYYDQGVARSGDLTEVTYLYSDDGGTSWSPPGPLTPRPFKAGWGNDQNQPNLGDYNQAAAQLGALYTAYAGTTPVGFADGQPSGSMTTPDIVFAKILVSRAPAPVHSGAVTFTDSGSDGNIDPGDTVRLRIPLINYVTNPLQAATLTGVSATLSTTTPGVTVTQAFSAYPNLAPGTTAVNAAEFVLEIAPGFAPGIPIQLSLAALSAQGSAILLLTQSTGTPVYTTLLNENFDSAAPGTLPAGWTAAHGAGANVVPWRTSNLFAPSLCGTSNKMFHPNASDGPPGGSPSRWERLFSPIFDVPPNAQYVTVDFDVCYDTEDDPVLPGVGYDGFFLRVADQTPGRLLRSVLAEAFEEEFTTGQLEHYPKHFPRNDDPNYFEDMSVWSGFSNGIQHVHLKLPGMEGSRAQLRWEFAQDGAGTCSDVRPGHACGVALDNVVVRGAISIAPTGANLVVRHSLSRDAGTNDIVAVLEVADTGDGPANNVQLTSLMLGSTPQANALPNLGSIPAGGSATTTVRFPGSAGASGAASVLRVAGSYAGKNFAVSLRVTLP